MEKTQQLWKNGPLFTQRDNVFPFGTPAVLLADFTLGTKSKLIKKVCELGCGSGIISLLLADALPDVRIDALDISEAAVELTRLNVEQNGFSDRVSVYCGDMRDENLQLDYGGYDMIVCNPPFFQANGGPVSIKQGVARSELECTLEQVCSAAAKLAAHNAEFALVYRPERLLELMEAMKNAGFEPKRMRLVHHSVKHKPNTVLISGKYCAKPGGLDILEPYIICKQNGEDTDENKRIYRKEEK